MADGTQEGRAENQHVRRLEFRLAGWVLLSFFLHLLIFLMLRAGEESAVADRVVVNEVFLAASANTEPQIAPIRPRRMFPSPAPCQDRSAPLPKPIVAESATNQASLPPSGQESLGGSGADRRAAAGSDAETAAPIEGKDYSTDQYLSIPAVESAYREKAVPVYESNPYPPYPRIAQRLGWEGEVLLRVVVSKTGNVGAVHVEQSSGHQALDESARDTVLKWRFRPALEGWMPVDSTIHVPISFELRRS